MVISSHHYAKIFDHSAAVQRQKTLTSILLKMSFCYIFGTMDISFIMWTNILRIYFVLFC